jgi:cyclase
VIACLDVRGDRVVKGTSFVALRDVGDPVELAERYERAGADEIVFLDISASAEQRRTMLDAVRRTAERVFIPLTVGGGVRSAEDVALTLRAGADKVSINSAAIERPALLTECAARFGSQCIVASIDAKRNERGSWEVFVRGGRTATGMDAVAWAGKCAQRGAGEILLTSIDRDGARNGYDLALTGAVAGVVNVPVIASGGAGNAAHVAEVLSDTRADAALVAGILHDGIATVDDIKDLLTRKHVPVRRSAR